MGDSLRCGFILVQVNTTKAMRAEKQIINTVMIPAVMKHEKLKCLLMENLVTLQKLKLHQKLDWVSHRSRS